MTSREYRLHEMAGGDVPEVALLERRVFPSPWPAASFRHELWANPCARSWVARAADGSLAGYACVWTLEGELLINNLAVAPEHRRRGVGRSLLERALRAGREARCQRALLEVRPSNAPALSLYSAYGFERIGLRRGYYSDGEDALVLGCSLPPADSDAPSRP